MKRLFAIGTFLFLVTAVLGPAKAEEKPIKLGAMFISSGLLGGYGINGQRAITMALEEINATGGILWIKLEFVFGDTKLKPEVAVDLSEKFINDDKVDFLMGPTSIGVALSHSSLPSVSPVHSRLQPHPIPLWQSVERGYLHPKHLSQHQFTTTGSSDVSKHSYSSSLPRSLFALFLLDRKQRAC